MQRKKIWVKPGQRGWQVRGQNEDEDYGHFPKKTEAVNRAREVAKNADLCRVIVQTNLGRIEAEYLYGEESGGSR